MLWMIARNGNNLAKTPRNRCSVITRCLTKFDRLFPTGSKDFDLRFGELVDRLRLQQLNQLLIVHSSTSGTAVEPRYALSHVRQGTSGIQRTRTQCRPNSELIRTMNRRFYFLAASQSPATAIKILFGSICRRSASTTFSGVNSVTRCSIFV